MKQVFVSHTKKDKALCDAFDRVCARVGIKAFRSEFETIPTPAWATIKDAMNQSVALFLLVGQELVQSQKSYDPTWRYTQNWIAYEIGLACQRGIDVWAICDNVHINFPMPYITNYLIATELHSPGPDFEYVKHIIEGYKKGLTFGQPLPDYVVTCPYPTCGALFNLHSALAPGTSIACPQCLQGMQFP